MRSATSMIRASLLASIAFSGLNVSAIAMAQAAAPAAAATADEDSNIIIVTASKRAATLQDTPISVAVTTKETIDRAQIRDLKDLQTLVPSLKVSQLQSSANTNFIIRGFGNGANNPGIEPSVGVFIDGVYRSRSAAQIGDLPNLERIEVLRGPQSTLFGKNVSAGAINIVTAKPQFTFGGSASVDFGNFHLAQERVSVTGPLSSTLAVRLSASNNQRHGYLENEVTGSDVNNRDRQSFRGDLLWKPSADLQARVIVDYNRMHETCCGVVSLQNGPATQFIGGVLGKPVGDPTHVFSDQTVLNTDPVNRLSGKGGSAQIDWKTGIGTFTSITADRKQTNASRQDVDFTGADLANKNQASDISTFTQELRLASNGGGPLHWMVGGFMQKEKLHTGVDTTFGSDMRAYADGLSGQVPAALLGALPAPLAAALAGQSNIYALELLQGLVTPTITPGTTYFGSGQGILDHYSMKQDSASLFGNADWDITDNLTLTGGLAWLTDRKRAASNVTLTDKFSQLNLQNVPQFGAIGLPPNLYGPLGALQFFYPDTANHAPVNFPNANETGELKGSKLTESLRANYDFGSWSAYAGWSTGWKAGAYNLSLDSRPPDANGIGRTAGPENVTSFEIGLKTETRKGYFTLAIFDQAIKGFQSNAYTGTAYSLVNAGKESTRGFEMDGAYRPAPWLALTGSATYLDAKYDSFTHAPCVSFDTERCPINPQTGQGPAFRDLSGQTPAGIPKWSFSASATLNQDFGGGLTGFLRAEYDFSSKVQLTETTPAALSTCGVNNVNASLGLESKPNHWSVALWARNLYDDRSMIGTFPTVAQSGSFSGFPNAPRTFGVTLGTKF